MCSLLVVVKAIYKSRGLLQKDIAHLLQISPKHLTNILSCRRQIPVGFFNDLHKHCFLTPEEVWTLENAVYELPIGSHKRDRLKILQEEVDGLYAQES